MILLISNNRLKKNVWPDVAIDFLLTQFHMVQGAFHTLIFVWLYYGQHYSEKVEVIRSNKNSSHKRDPEGS